MRCDDEVMARVTGLLLAAGAGRRMGGPKALVRATDGESWVEASRRVLLDGGCDDVLVVLGASADQAAALLPGDTPAVVADDWTDGMSASLRAGLSALDGVDDGADAALVHLVDLPDVGADVVARVLEQASSDALARAVYDGHPGHPVLIGRAHWDAIRREASGDRGARDYLSAHDVVEVDCSDLASGRDVDRRSEPTNDPAT